MSNEMKLPVMRRSFELQRADVDVDARTVAIAFSSETPVDRVFGSEVLDHSPTSIRLGRLQNGGPVLVDHSPTDQVGVVEQVSIAGDRRGRAVIRFGRGVRASEIFNDVTDGIRRGVSVGYRVHEMVLEKRGNGASLDSYRVTDWEPLEVSIVSIPADVSVGVGRDDGGEPASVRILFTTDEVSNMEQQTPAPQAQPTVDVRAIENEARRNETDRVRAIRSMGEGFSYSEAADKAIADGTPVEAFRAQLIAHMEATRKAPSAEVGMSPAEVKRFSFVRAIHALSNPTDRRAQEAAAFEFEASQAAASKLGRESRGITVPADVLVRDLSVGTAADGGYVVATELKSDAFIDLLRNRSYMMQLATVMSGLNGNIAIPRQTAGATAYWVAEAGAPTESQQTFDQVTMTPKTVGAVTDFSRKLMLQSSVDIESVVRRDLAAKIALEIDRVALHGSGSSNQPTGIASTAGIGSVAGGTNGAAPSWANIVSLEAEVAIDNADLGSLAYVTNAKVRGKLKVTEKASTTGLWVWTDGAQALNGYNTYVTNQVSSALTKGTASGVCSAIFFGNWSDLMIGLWSGLDLLVDPYQGAASGTVRVRALQDVDLAVRHAESFAAMLDALTT